MFLYEPPDPPKVKRRSAGSANQSRVEEVFDELWKDSLPPNPQALSRAQQLVRQSKVNHKELAKEIIADPGLGLHYLKKVRALGESDIMPADPLELLPSLSQEQLLEIFDKPAEAISKHDMKKATPAQLLRMQHSYISAKASANLSRQMSVPEGQSFTLSQLAQITLNLLAWNYPSQFQRALLYKRRYRTDISETLNSLIGVDPKALNTKLIKTLGLPIRFIEDLKTLQNTKNVGLQNPSEPIALVQAGELLARANDVEHFPEALNQWSEVEDQIDRLGLESPRIEIEHEIKNFMSELGVENNLPFKSALFPLKEAVIQAKQLSSDSNPFIRKLPQSLQDDFRSIYQIIHKDTFSAAGLKFLAEKVAGSTGVHSGYLYLLKPDNQTLSVTLNFGQYKKKHRDLQITSNDPVAQSIFSAMPLTIELDDKLVLVCCSLQNCKKQAVLALEWDVSRYASIATYATPLLQAFAFTLVDVMGQRVS